MKGHTRDGDLPLVGLLTALAITVPFAVRNMIFPQPTPELYYNIEIVEEQFGREQACEKAHKLVEQNNLKYLDAATTFIRKNCLLQTYDHLDY